MPTALTRIWTQFAMSISYDDNYYITNPCGICIVSLIDENIL